MTQVANTFNNYFNDVVKNLLTVTIYFYAVTNKKLPKEKTKDFNLNLLDPVGAATLKYKSRPSLNTIRGKISKLDNPKFLFTIYIL